MEEEEVDVVVVLGEEVAQHTVGVAALDLVGRQAEVDALDKVPELGDGVLVEPPGGGGKTVSARIINKQCIHKQSQPLTEEPTQTARARGTPRPEERLLLISFVDALSAFNTVSACILINGSPQRESNPQPCQC